jgi:hypothetical protein
MCCGHLVASTEFRAFDQAWQLRRSALLAARRPIPQCSHYALEALESHPKSLPKDLVVFDAPTVKDDVQACHQTKPSPIVLEGATDLVFLREGT